MITPNPALEWARQQGGAFHDSGNLHPYVLQAISNHAARIGAKETAETGCGLSTVVLSSIAECHTCFTVAAGNSLERVQAVPALRREAVNFVIGPAQLTLARHTFPRPLDLVLIDGPHGFPFPCLEYFHFYPRMRRGAVLIIDDIHIPTIRQMVDVLRDDRMWTHLEDVLTTAFFQRTDAPLFDPFGDGWERQQFNQRHFQDTALLDEHVPGWRERMPPQAAPLLGQDSDRAVVTQENIEASRRHEEFIGLFGEIERLKAENAALRASTSWRATAPLRAASKILRRR